MDELQKKLLEEKRKLEFAQQQAQKDRTPTLVNIQGKPIVTVQQESQPSQIDIKTAETIKKEGVD